MGTRHEHDPYAYPPEVSAASAATKRELHKLEDSSTVVTGLPSWLALVDGMSSWLRPVGVQRGIRVRGRSARPPSWPTVVS